MAFSLSGTTITQTGTDADLSGLAGIAGVTVTSYANYTSYSLDNLTLSIEGDLTQTNHEELSFINGNTNAIRVLSGGVFTFGAQTAFTLNSGGVTTLNDGGHSINIGKPTGTPFKADQLGIRVFSGGIMRIYGGLITSNKAVRFELGSDVTIRDGHFIFDSDIGYQNFYLDGPLLDVENLIVQDKSAAGKLSVGVRTNYTQFSGYRAIATSAAISSIDSLNFGLIELEKYGGGGSNRTDVRLRTTQDTNEYRLFEATVGNSLYVEGRGSGSESRGFTTHYIRFNPVFKDAATGLPVEGVKFQLTDTDNGNRLSPYSPSTQVYSGTSIADGTLPAKLDVLTGVWHNNGNANASAFTLDDRMNVTGGAISYEHNFRQLALIDSAVQEYNSDELMVEDTLITEPDKSVTDAYTELDTTAKFYDRAKSYLVDNYAGENQTIVSRSGDTINAGSYDVVLTSGGSNTFELDGSTITVRCGTTFTGNITTTGTVTLSGSASVSGAIIDSTADSALVFSGIDSWVVYSTEADRDANTNALASGSGAENYRFNYVPATTYYLRLVVSGETTFKAVTPTEAGETVVSLQTAALLTGVSAKIDTVTAHAKAANMQTKKV